MDDIKIFQDRVRLFFDNTRLSRQFWDILVKYKKIDNSIVYKIDDERIVIASAKDGYQEIFCIVKRQEFSILIRKSLCGYFPFNIDTAQKIYKELSIPYTDIGCEEHNSREERDNETKAASKVAKTNSTKKKTTLVNKKVEKPRETTEKKQPGRDIHIICQTCGKRFVFTKGEAEFFKSKGFELPRRCKECRKNNVHIEKDYYEIGLKHNSYQRALDTYGGRIGVNGPAQSEGYTSLY